jgi:hypothetical protein
MTFNSERRSRDRDMTKRLAVLLALVVCAVTASTASATVRDKPVSPQMALDWNSYAVDAVRAALTLDGVPPGGAPRALYQPEGLIYMAYVEGAVYDAVTKIEHRYRPYHHFEAAAGDASPEAAVASAAYATLVHYLGDPSGTLAAHYAASLGTLPADMTTARGIAVGQAAAADIEQLRAGDGLDATTAVFGAPFAYDLTNAGQWQVVPPFVAVGAQTPWVAFMRPFTLESASQFRAPPPPALGSAQYAADFNETKDYGSATSILRTPDETAIARFWNANVPSQQNQLYRDVAVQHSMDLVDTVHLMAMGSLTTADAGIACFDSKYNYLAWRPYSAIRNADLDGNPATTADPTWLPLLSTPNHPEYPAAHGCITAALADVLANALGTQTIDATIWGATGGATTLTTTEHFDTTQQLKDEIVNARVWAGLHWRSSVIAGESLGDSVAGWALSHYFGSLGDGSDSD